MYKYKDKLRKKEGDKKEEVKIDSIVNISENINKVKAEIH